MLRHDWSGEGGGLRCEVGSSATLMNCTISWNMAHIGGAISCHSSSPPTLTNCIVWGNRPDAIRSIDDSTAPAVRYSCVEGADVWPGVGNINSDPEFCGWLASEVWVDATHPGPGTGTEADPYSHIGLALTGFLLTLQEGSPCLGSGEGGKDMGAVPGTCSAAGYDSRIVHLGTGTYPIGHFSLAHDVSIEGSGADSTTIEGTVYGLRTGSFLSSLTITKGAQIGIMIALGESPEIRNCKISGNGRYYGEGGGVRCPDSSPLLTNCTIADNMGTGIYAPGGAPTLINCMISGNGGGGVSCSNSSTVSLTNCTISGNSTYSNGGGVYCSGSSPTLTNCTISGNLAGNQGGGVYFSYESTATLSNCIVWGNAGGAVVSAETPNLSVIMYSCIESADVWPGIGNINSDPGFCGWPASEVWVDANRPGPGTGTEADPYSDIRSALSGYRLTLQEGSPCIGSGEGGKDMGATTGTCDTAGYASRILHLGSGTYAVGGFALTHQASIQGASQETTMIEGTVYGLRTGAFLSDVTVSKGRSDGIVVPPGEAPAIRECRITETWRKGIVLGPSSSAGVTNCTVWGNTGSGVISLSNSTSTLTNCTIVGNGDNSGDAGVWCQDSSPTFRNCTIVGNFDAGVRLSDSSATLSNCVIAGNRGDGVCCFRGFPTLTNCTISENWYWPGHGVYCEDSSPTVSNCVVWGNSSALVSQSSNFPGNQTVSYCVIQGDPVWPGEGNINREPHFVRLGHWEDCGATADIGCVPYQWSSDTGQPTAWQRWVFDYHLQSGSAAIDAGTCEGAPPTDIEAVPRPEGAGCDIGAYEFVDCNRNGTDDRVEIRHGTTQDCNYDGIPDACEIASGTSKDSNENGMPDECEASFLRGDSNADGVTDISDAVAILNYLFLGAKKVPCEQAGDANDDGALDISDGAYVVNFLFLGGPAIEPPARTCGVDPTGHELTCADFSGCQ